MKKIKNIAVWLPIVGILIMLYDHIVNNNTRMYWPDRFWWPYSFLANLITCLYILQLIYKVF